jgi:AraC-like DNA-binding protein
VLNGHAFRHIPGEGLARPEPDKPNGESLLALLAQSVIERFIRISNRALTAVPIGFSAPQDAEEPQPSPCHPACAQHSDKDYCRESWQLHLAELREKPGTHWHKCDLDRLCALVPIVYQGRCLAAVKIACPAAIGEKEFECQVELLDLLVRDFVVSQTDLLARLASVVPAVGKPSELTAQTGEKPAELSTRHPQILRAIQYVEEHLSEPKLTVGRVAEALDINPNYLSQLFVEQVGQRMSRFIAARRVELAKTLLLTTNWQVKRIACETGHANPNWFCRIFAVYTGLTPGEFRSKACGEARAAAG